MAKILDRVKELGSDLNNSLKETNALSVLLANMNNPYAQRAGAVAGALGYGRRKKPAAKKPKAGGRKKKPKTAAQKKAAMMRKLKKKYGAGFFDFLKNVASVPILAAGGALGGLNGGIQSL